MFPHFTQKVIRPVKPLVQRCSGCKDFIHQFEGKLDLCFEDECIEG